MKYKSRVKGKDHFLDGRIVEAIWKGITQAETGNSQYGQWIRATNATSKGSFAFGPGQINSLKAQDFLTRPDLYGLDQSELNFIESEMLPLMNQFAINGRNGNLMKDTNQYDLQGNVNPNFGKSIIPQNVWKTDAINPNAVTPHASLNNGEIYYNPVFDYLSQTNKMSANFRGVGDNVLLEYYKNDPNPQQRVDDFKDMYNKVGKKAIVGTYFSSNEYAKQWGYQSHMDSSPAGEIGSTIANWRFGAQDASNDENLLASHASMISNPQGALGADWERYQEEAFDVIAKELNDPTDPYVFGGEQKHYKLEDNIQDVKNRKATHLVPQMFYEKPDGSGGTKKVYVDANEVIQEMLFEELDFTRLT